MLENTSRRSFVKGAAMGAAALGVAAAAGSTALADEAEEPAEASGEYTFADTIAWDGEYDVVVMGFGGAGAWASLAAARAGASVLAVDVAPKGHEGGNFRLSGQIFIIYDDAQAAYDFFVGQYQGLDYDEEMVREFAEAITHTADYLESIGLPESDFVDATDAWGFGNSFHFEGYEHRKEYCAHDGNYDSYIWRALRAACEEESDNIDLWLETPAKHLIQADDTGTILGVQVEHEGELLNIRARNGVVMTTGGYENNPEMIQNFLNIPRSVCMTSLYNKGDGIVMGTEVGAALWHTFVYDGLGYWGGSALPVDEGVMLPNNDMMGRPCMVNGSIFAVTPGGVRFMDEARKTDHGRALWSGIWCNPHWSPRNYLVTDAAGYAEMVEDGSFDEWLDQFESGETFEELGEKLDIDPDGLYQTQSDVAAFIEMGHDPIAGRDVTTMRAWGDGPYYGIPIYPAMHGTRGGIRQDKDTQVVDPEGNVIPHLYCAGENGSIYAYLRGGGGGVTECIICGTLAGQKAAEEKDPLPAYSARPQVASPMTYTLGNSVNELLDNDEEVEAGDNQYVGTSENGMGGKVQLLVTIEDGVIEEIDVALENETPAIGSVAFSDLIDQALAAQSADIDGVSGATTTTRAFKEALEDAMAQAGM